MIQQNPILEKGKYLLAEPFLQDPNFKRSVILLTEHNEEGSIGFILNRKVSLEVGELIKEIGDTGFKSPLYIGGPVSPNSLHFIHRVTSLKPYSENLGGGVYWGTDFEKLFESIQLGNVGPDDIRFFLGYSGWEPKQLEQELKVNSWIISPAKEKFTFSVDVNNLWRDILVNLGSKFKALSFYPEDPSLN